MLTTASLSLSWQTIAPSAAGLTIAPGVISWQGPSHPAADAPWLGWRLNATGAAQVLAEAIATNDAATLGQCLATVPMSAGLVALLAERCVASAPESVLAVIRGKTVADLRWHQALIRAYQAAGHAITGPDEAEPPFVLQVGPDECISHLRELADGALAALVEPATRPGLVRLVVVTESGPPTSISFAAPPETVFALPMPESGLDGPLVVTAHDASTSAFTAWALAPDLTLLQRGQGHLSEPAVTFAWGETTWRLSNWRETMLVTPLATPVAGNPLAPLPAAAPVSAQAPAEPVPVPPAPTQPFRLNGDGFLVHQSEPSQVLLPESASALAIDGQTAWLATHYPYAIIAFDLACESVQWRTPLPCQATGLYRVPKGLLATSWSRWFWLSDDGQVRAKSAERREVGQARLADGSQAISAGEDVLVLRPDGTMAARPFLPYDGQIIGATAERFVFGPVSGGSDRLPSDAFYAIDAEGTVTSRVRFELGSGLRRNCRRIHYAGGMSGDDGLIGHHHIWLMSADGQQLRRWDPQAPAIAGANLAPLPPPTELRQQRVIRHDTINPRDDWAEAGLALAGGQALILDSSYGGTTGVAEGPAIDISDGCVATFVRCRFVAGGGTLQRAATVILIDCQLPLGSWEIGEHCHLVIFGGDVPVDTSFWLHEGASLTAPDHEPYPLIADRIGLRPKQTP